MSQFFSNFAKRLKRTDTKRFFGKVSLVFAQFKKVLNFQKCLFVFCFNVNWSLRHASWYSCLSIDSLIWKCLPSYNFSIQIIISRLKFSLTFRNELLFAAHQRLLLVFNWCNRKNSMNSFVNILWIYSYTPTINSKLVSTTTLLPWKFSCTIQIPSVPLLGINNDQSLRQNHLIILKAFLNWRSWQTLISVWRHCQKVLWITGICTSK